MTEGWAILKDSSPKSPASLRHRPYNLGRAPIGTQVDDGVTTQTSLQVCSNAVLLKRASTVQPPPASCSIMQSYIAPTASWGCRLGSRIRATCKTVQRDRVQSEGRNRLVPDGYD